MTEQDKGFESESPFGAPAEPPPGPSPFAAQPAASQAAPSGGGALHHVAPIAAFMLLVVFTAAALGAVAGHELWASPRAPAPVSAPNAGANGNGSSSVNPFPSFGGGSGSFGNGSNGSSTSSAGGGPSDPAAIAAKVNPGLVDINSNFSYQGGAGAGTGIVLSPDGEVLTNNHVIQGATQITATDIGNGKTYTATVVGYDPSHDIAVLKLQGASNLATAKFGDSSKLSVGQAVVGIGNAGGTGGTPSAAGGQITALNQSITAGDDFGGTTENLHGLIAVNADIQPGDSGGPLVDDQGRVIGMDTAGSAGFSISGFGGSGGSAYAIPVDTAVQTATAIVTNHPTSTVHVGPTAFLGVTVTNGGGGGLTVPGFGTIGGTGSSASGVQLGNVLNGQAAQKAGLVAGDTITALNGVAVDTPTALSHAMLSHHPGDTVQIRWVDNSGVSHTTSITLGSGPAA